MKLITESLFRCLQGRIPADAGIDSKNRGAGKAENMVFLEFFNNSKVHITELATMALIEDNDDMFVINRVFRILADKDV